MYFSFSVISVFSPYSRCFSVHFSCFTFFSDFVSFQVVKWMFLIFHDFQFSCHIPRPTVGISKFSTFFRFPQNISSPKVYISHFPRFSVFLPYSRSYRCAFLIFHLFKWFPHFSSRQVEVSHFPWFSVLLPYSMSYSGHL